MLAKNKDFEMEKEDERCCGTGYCMINTDGRCWCGQQWDGEKMCHPKPAAKAEIKSDATITSACIASDNTPS
jgi:hypothetical protein